MKVVGFGCGPWRWYRGVGEIHMNKGGVGEERGGKEMDRCPLTPVTTLSQCYPYPCHALDVYTYEVIQEASLTYSLTVQGDY
jgi:hypothetical protein